MLLFDFRFQNKRIARHWNAMNALVLFALVIHCRRKLCSSLIKISSHLHSTPNMNKIAFKCIVHRGNIGVIFTLIVVSKTGLDDFRRNWFGINRKMGYILLYTSKFSNQLRQKSSRPAVDTTIGAKMASTFSLCMIPNIERSPFVEHPSVFFLVVVDVVYFEIKYWLRITQLVAFNMNEKRNRWPLRVVFTVNVALTDIIVIRLFASNVVVNKMFKWIERTILKAK